MDSNQSNCTDLFSPELYEYTTSKGRKQDREVKQEAGAQSTKQRLLEGKDCAGLFTSESPALGTLLGSQKAINKSE